MQAMEIIKEKLGFDSKRFSAILVICFIVLTATLMVSAKFRNSEFELNRILKRNPQIPAAAEDATVGQKIDDSFDKKLNISLDHDKSGKESYSRNDSSDHTTKLLNITVSPGVTKDSGLRKDSSYSRNDSSDPTTKLLNITVSPEVTKDSGLRKDSSYSRNDSSDPTTKLLNITVNPEVTKDSGLRKDSSYSGNDSSAHTTKLLNITVTPGVSKDSGLRKDSSYSRNDSSNHTTKLLNITVTPGVTKDSGLRKDSSHKQLLKDSGVANDSDSGLDDTEKSCISRYQSVLYRRTPTHKPSSYLLSKLRNYEDLHKSCGPFTKSYEKASKRLKSGKSSSSKCKYIVWLPVNGLGNRIVSMASTFLYALLSNRVLLVDHRNDMVGLFCEPFPDTSWLLPDRSPLKRELRVASREFKRAQSFARSVVNMSIKSRPTHLYLDLDHGDYDQDKKLFYCNKGEALLREVTWLILQSDQYFAPAFFFSSTYKEEVSKLFPEKDTIFYHLGHYLFSPSNQAWGLITRFYDAYLAKADQRVGLQIRVFNPKKTPLQKVLDQILSCTRTQKILPQVEKNETLHSKVKNRTLEAVLVTSLHSEFYENLKNMYWSSASMTGEAIGVYQASHEEYQHFGDNMHNMKAWVEMYLLSLSDELVTSARSTFGYVAQGLGGLKPWILHKMDCVRDLSMEPCFHYPKIYNCHEKVKIDVGDSFPYLRHCKDSNGGVRLVPYEEEV